MSLDTKWDIDYYKTEYESDEHWQLRRRFMEVHKEKFGEDELVCLAQVFTNVEFMGCKYPDETMQLVAQLSQDVAKEFRENRAKKIQRTFVKASDAAEARYKGKDQPPPIHQSNNIKIREKLSSTSTDVGKEQDIRESKMFTGLPYKNFVLFLMDDRSALQVSGHKSGVKVESKELTNKDSREIQIYLDGKIAAVASASTLKEARQKAFDAAIEKLKTACYTITLKKNPDRIDIKKTEKTVTCSVKKTEQETKLDSNNIGYKMMQKLGWTGGGLGSTFQGRSEPVDYLIKCNRKGLGNNSGEINSNYFRNLLNNYSHSSDIRDLHFDSGFTKDERVSIHRIAGEKNLRSSSYGKEPNRYLVIGKKDPPRHILAEILLHRRANYLNKYIVTVPESKKHLYPDYVENES